MEKNFKELFAGTFLDGFFKLEEKDYIDSNIKKEQNEFIVGKMSDAEKRIFTLIVKHCRDLLNLAPTFGLGTYNVDLKELLITESESLLETVFDEAEYQYNEAEMEFPWETWEIFSRLFEEYQMLFDLLNAIIYTRLMPRYFCAKPLFRRGFLIVKDSFEVIQDDGTFEDTEKIANQNFLFN